MAREMGGKPAECGIHMDIYGEWPLVIFCICNLAKAGERHFNLISNHMICRTDSVSATCNGFIPGINHTHIEILKHILQDK